MNQHKRSFVGLIAVGFLFAACQKPLATHQPEHPAEIKQIEGSDLSHVTLTEKAIERLALETDVVREMRVSRSTLPRIVVPYSSLIYDPQGQTWVYISPQSRTFVRHKVDVDYIEGNIAVLSHGPPVGTIIASVAVAELYGAEFKVGH